MRSPKHKLTQSGKGWFKRIGAEVRWICSLRAAPTGREADAIFEEKFHDLCTPARDRAQPVTVADLADMFLTRKREERDAGNLDPRTYEDYAQAIQAFVDAVGDAVYADDLSPAHFGQFRSRIATKGVHRRSKMTIIVRMAFNWGHAMRLIERPDYGPDFRPPTRAEFRKARAKREAQSGHQLYTADHVQKLVAYAGAWNVRPMVLLALNGGFGNTDLAELTWSAVGADGWIRYRRGKTGIARAVPLWPETIEALATVRYPKATGRPADGRVFVTRQGQPLVGGDGSAGNSHKDAVAILFARVCEAVGVPNHGFYSLRRTFRTVADGCGDTRAIARIMGHEVGDVADIYVQDITADRMQRVVNHVRDALRIADARSAASAADDAARRRRSDAARAWRQQKAAGRTRASRATRGARTERSPR